MVRTGSNNNNKRVFTVASKIIKEDTTKNGTIANGKKENNSNLCNEIDCSYLLGDTVRKFKAKGTRLNLIVSILMITVRMKQTYC